MINNKPCSAEEWNLLTEEAQGREALKATLDNILND